MVGSLKVIRDILVRIKHKERIMKEKKEKRVFNPLFAVEGDRNNSENGNAMITMLGCYVPPPNFDLCQPTIALGGC